MQPVSEQFQKVMGATLASVLIIAAGLFVALCINPPARVGAQNAGVVGLYTRSIPVFSSQATSASSAILPDYGFAANFLSYCDTAFAGSIDLEWSPSGVSGSFQTLARATYSVSTPDNACHILQLGGYFPNMRSSVTRLAGSISAWYSASAAPIPLVSSGLGSNGPSSPINCDQSTVVFGIATGATAAVGAPINSGDTVVICNFNWSFNGATSAGTVAIGWSTSAACASLLTTWEIYTTASTPQYFPVPLQQRSNDPLRQYFCFVNSSGATISADVSWASVHL